MKLIGFNVRQITKRFFCFCIVLCAYVFYLQDSLADYSSFRGDSLPSSNPLEQSFQSVEWGQYFWEIESPEPHVESSYIMGARHNMCLDDHSLPEEVKLALTKATTGLIELSSKGFGSYEQFPLYLPEGLSLSTFLGENKVRQMFDFVYPFFDRFAEEIKKSLSFVFPQETVEQFNFSVFNLNRLSPHAVTAILQLKIIFEVNFENQTQPFLEFVNQNLVATSQQVMTFSNTDRETWFENRDCLSDTSWSMDLFIEKWLFCNNKPIVSLETGQSQILDMSGISRDLKTQILDLGRAFNTLTNQANENPDIYQLFKNLDYIIWDNYLLKTKLEGIFLDDEVATINYQDARRQSRDDIFGFLSSQSQCTVTPFIDMLIDNYLKIAEQRSDFVLQVINKGELMSATLQNDYFELVYRQVLMKRDILLACSQDFQQTYFSDVLAYDLKKEAQDGAQKLQLQVKNFFVSRDKKMVHKSLKFLDQGHAFLLVGFSHLNGVIKELQTLGYTVRPILVRGIVEAESCFGLEEFIQQKLLGLNNPQNTEEGDWTPPEDNYVDETAEPLPMKTPE